MTWETQQWPQSTASSMGEGGQGTETWEAEEWWGTGRDEFTERILKKSVLRKNHFGCFLMEKSSWMKMKVKDSQERDEAGGWWFPQGTKWNPSHFNYEQRS